MFSIKEARISGRRMMLTVFHEHPSEEYFSLDITIGEVKAWGISPQDLAMNPQLYVLDEEVQLPPIDLSNKEQSEPLRRIRKKKLLLNGSML